MDMSGDRLIAVPKEKIWDALNDPDVLKACIPGCESVEKLSDTAWKILAAVKLGPIAALFTGTILLSDLDPPNGYTISGEGQGGAAGSAKGGVNVTLRDEDGGTSLAYTLNAQMDGKMAELEVGLVESAAKQMAESFFTKFSALVAPPTPQPMPVMAAAYHLPHEDHDHDPSNPHYFGLPLGVIIPACVATVSVALVLFKFL